MNKYTLYDTLDILLFMLHIFTLALVGFNRLTSVPQYHVCIPVNFFIVVRVQDDWKNYFSNASIPDEHSQTYAQSFVDNGLNEHSLASLDKDTLIELNVNILGHWLSILISPSTEIHHYSVHLQCYQCYLKHQYLPNYQLLLAQKWRNHSSESLKQTGMCIRP